MSDENETLAPQKGIIGDVISGAVTTNPYLLVLSKTWKWIVLALLLGTIGFQHFMLKADDAKISEQKAANAQMQVQLTEAHNKVTDLSNQITVLSTKSTELQTEVNNLTPILNQIKTNTDATVSKILKQPVPVTCKDIQDYIINGQHGFTWSKK